MSWRRTIARIGFTGCEVGRVIIRVEAAFVSSLGCGRVHQCGRRSRSFPAIGRAIAYEIDDSKRARIRFGTAR